MLDKGMSVSCIGAALGHAALPRCFRNPVVAPSSLCALRVKDMCTVVCSKLKAVTSGSMTAFHTGVSAP